MSITIQVGRQPIFSKTQDLIGYELLYRDSCTRNSANIIDGDAATANVLTNAMLEIGFDHLVGDALAFINFTKPFLDGTTPIPLEPSHIVVEILEDVKIDSQLEAGVWGLSAAGYRIALDDFVYSPQWDQLLEIADIVKLDLLKMPEQDLNDHVQLLREYDVTLLAEKVENHDQFAMCKELGFDLFQGYFFAKPNIIKIKSSKASHGTLLATLAVVNNQESGPEEIDAVASQDAMLVHKFLRYVNSSAFGRRNKVETILQAVVYLGKEKIRAMVNLLLLTSISNKPPILLHTALIRAMACENLAKAMGEEKSDVFFAVGLLSMLDALLDQPLEDIVKELPVPASFRQALLNHQGVMGACLDAVIACEQVDHVAISKLPLSDSSQYKAYQKAIDSLEQRKGMAGLLPALSRYIPKNAFRKSNVQ